MSSPEEIANIALDHLKEAPIDTFNDGTSRSDWFLRNFYPTALSLIRTTKPNFARTRWLLKLDDSTPAFGWARQYKQPNDMLGLFPLRVGGNVNGARVPYEFENHLILTNAGPGELPARGTRKVTNTGQYEPLFVQVLATTLALRVAHFITAKNSLVESLGAVHRDAVNAFDVENAQENPYAMPTPDVSQILTARD